MTALPYLQRSLRLWAVVHVAVALSWGVGRAARAAESALPAAAELTVTADRPVVAFRLREGSRINSNRPYVFSQVPAALIGLQYTAHEHKTPATLECEVRKAGRLHLLLGEGAALSAAGGGLAWTMAGTFRGSDGGAVRDWVWYSAEVTAGARFTVRSPNKWGAVLVAAGFGLPAAGHPDAMAREYRLLKSQLAKPPDAARQERLQREALNAAALLSAHDRDPLDVVLRRSQALLNDLARQPDGPDLTAERQDLERLAAAAAAVAPERESERQTLFRQVCGVRRRIAFRNPLLSFDRIAFLTHGRTCRGNSHMCDQYFGFNAMPGGSLFVLEGAFTAEPKVRDLLADAVVENGRLQGRRFSELNGSFISLELAHDASTFYFAWTEAVPDAGRWRPETCYHLFRVQADGSGLRQLTDGAWNDFDPCCLPDGRLAFISERRGGFGRCHGRPVPTYTLHSMAADGSGITPLSLHETNEWHPSVDHNGMIVFSRWDYVDRDSDIAHHLWLCFPDGRDPRSYHGNYPVERELRPWMELSLRAVPGSPRYVGVAAAHHGQAYGSLVLIDQRPDDDGATSQAKRITPLSAFPESEKGPQSYGTPWPLSETYYLCVFDGEGQHYGITLVDAFGNHELLWEDPELPCLDPIPLQPRPLPPVVPTVAASPSEASGRVAVMDVYRSDFAWPAGTRIAALRVVQVYPKTTQNASEPAIGVAAQSLARGVLGTVPVEADGSAYFEMPVAVPVYFQALDERGLAVQGMRSDAFVHAGELLSCLGCHEPKRQAGPVQRRAPPSALSRPPSRLTPEPEGSRPLSFPRLVQPVLDRHCVTCHAASPKAPRLDGGPSGRNGWSNAYVTLSRYAYAKAGGNGAIRSQGSRSVAGATGARASKLLRLLDAGHHKVTLPAADLRRITLWLDCNSNFFGAYHDTARQAAGEAVQPTVQ